MFCEYNADDEVDLNLHLHTCEIFTCGECEPRFLSKNIYDLKAHLKKCYDSIPVVWGPSGDEADVNK